MSVILSGRDSLCSRWLQAPSKESCKTVGIAAVGMALSYFTPSTMLIGTSVLGSAYLGKKFWSMRSGQLSPTEKKANELFNGLGKEWWRQIIDGRFQGGKYDHLVFDRGDHGWAVEPGFFSGIESGHRYAQEHLGEKPTVDFYTTLHKKACSHFRGEANETLMRGDEAGRFRNNRNVKNVIRFDVLPENCYEVVNTLQDYIDQLNESFNLNFPLVEFKINEREHSLSLHVPSKYFDGPAPLSEQIEKLVSKILHGYNKAISDLDARIQQAEDGEEIELLREQKFNATVYLHQMLEWLHPFDDGNTRTNLLLLSFNLARNGFNPPILPNPCACYYMEPQDWANYVKEGMRGWKATKLKQTS